MSDEVALYLRVSTADQDLAGQERDLRLYAASRGWKIGCVFSEKTSAAGKVEREAWQQLREEACLPMTRRFEHVLVWALDRWSREPSFVRAVGSIEDLELLGIRFHSFREPTLDSGDDDSPNLARDLLRGILPTIAAFEARRRSERTRVAMREIREGRRATRSGRPVGRPRRVTPALAQKALELHEQGRTWKEVAQRVGLPCGTARNAASSLKRARRPAQNGGSERKGRASEDQSSDILPEI
jgi:DNA invertase Pin-like site-specific DNA recombinase